MAQSHSTLELIRGTQTQVAVKYNLIGNTSQALEPAQHLTLTIDDWKLRNTKSQVSASSETYWKTF